MNEYPRPEERTHGSDPSKRIDTVLYLLSHRYRRYVLYRLSEGDGAVPREELVESVIDRESRRRDDGNDIREQVGISLYHSHLPKLESVGAVLRTDHGYVCTTSSLLDAWLERAAAVEGGPATGGE